MLPCTTELLLALTLVIMLRSRTKVIISSVKSAQSFHHQSPKKAMFAAYGHSQTWTGIVTADWHTLQIKKVKYVRSKKVQKLSRNISVR